MKNWIHKFYKFLSKLIYLLIILKFLFSCNRSVEQKFHGMFSLINQSSSTSSDLTTGSKTSTSTSSSANISLEFGGLSNATIAGTVTGLFGSGLVLQNNGGDNLSISANGTFTFKSTLASGNSYLVTVLVNPSSPTQTCNVTSGSGTVTSANITNVSITCITNSYTISGSVSGLTGSFNLNLNSSETLLISSNGLYSFVTSVNSGASYTVAATTQPTNQFCTVGTGSVVNNTTGTVDTANISIPVDCLTGNTVGPVVGGTIFNPLVLGGVVTTIPSGTLTGINGVTTDGVYVYIAVYDDNTILRLEISTGTIFTLAGLSGNSGTTTNVIGTAARFTNPASLVFLNNSLYITDYGSGQIRKLDLSNNMVTTIVDLGAGTNPYGITTDGSFLYFTINGMIKSFQISNNNLVTLVGSSTTGFLDGIGSAAQFRNSMGSITYLNSNLYYNDRFNCAVRKIVISTKQVITIVGNPPPTAACSVTDGSGNTIDGSGNVIGTGTSRIGDPDGIVTDGTDLYLAESNGSVIRKITLNSFNVTTFAGTLNNRSLTNGTGAAAKFNYPAGLTSDGTYLYVSDYGNNKIRKIQ